MFPTGRQKNLPSLLSLEICVFLNSFSHPKNVSKRACKKHTDHLAFLALAFIVKFTLGVPVKL